MPFWTPEIHALRRPRLVRRQAIRRAIAGWFEAELFLEVETATLAVSPGNETHLHAFATARRGLDGGASPLHLVTSPEFALKKLLAAGESRIFEFARVFRNREAGPLNVHEFTMLEWYRAGETTERLIADVAALVSLAAETAGTRVFRWRGRSCDPRAPMERLTLVDAFARHAGIDLEAVLGDTALFAAAVRARGMRVAEDDGWSDLFSRVVAEAIEPKLGDGRVTILERYPLSEAALARPCPDDPRFADRFEVYACGIELANAFGELTDAAEQRRRFVADMDEKERVHGERYPLDEDFLAALALMPEAARIALGFDRLAMLATGADTVAEVQFAPLEGVS